MRPRLIQSVPGLDPNGSPVQPLETPELQIINHISFGGRRFNLREPIQVTVSLDHGLWEYQADAFGIQSFGPSKDLAESSFYEDFAVIYDQIAQESDDTLTPEAITLKRALLNVVESVA